MGRRPLDIPVHQIRVTLSLREGDDDDLLAFLADLPYRGKAGAVKALLRKGLEAETKRTGNIP